MLLEYAWRNLRLTNKKKEPGQTKREETHLELMVVSSLAHSRHISGLKGNNELIVSLACLSFSMSPCFRRTLIYYKKHQIENCKAMP